MTAPVTRTREQLVQQIEQLTGLKEQLSNTWQQTVGKIELLNQLLAEIDKEQPTAQ